MRIAVVGLGVAGGAAATLFARNGAEVTVFEQAPEPGPAGTGFLLQPSGRAILEKHGLLDEVLANAWSITRFRARHAAGRQLTSLAMDAHGVARGVLFGTLARAAVTAGADLRAGLRVTSFSETESCVTLRDAEGKALGEFDLAIAADGARSALRHALDPRRPTGLSAYGALWAIGETGGTCPNELLQETRGTRTLMGLLPVGAHRTTFFAGIRACDLEKVRAEGFPAFAAKIAPLFPEAKEVVESIGDFSRFAFARYGHAAPRRGHSKRLVLIGDAAHPMSPHLGQGANLALLDADALAEAVSRYGVSERAFAAYLNSRHAHARFYARLSRMLAPTFQSDLTWLGPARDIALPLMTAVPPVRRIMEDTLAGGRRGIVFG